VPARKLAYQVVKYQARDGWSNRDLLRLSHPKARTIAHDQIYRWVTRGTLDTDAPDELSLIGAYEQIQHASSLTEVVRLIEKHAMPREAVPTHWLKSADVWRSLLPRMPMTAMMRNLATMTRVGLISPLSAESTLIAQRLADTDHLRKARVHPLAVLTALMTYRAGHGARGKHSWSPVASIVDALDSAFYRTFDNVAPSGARTLLALDVSGSMGCGLIGGVPGLTPRVASAAMALVTAATETQHGFVAFTGAGGHVRNASATRGISTLDISPHQRLDDVVARVSSLPFGGTDCSLPMRWALENRIPVDAFAIYTDSETWCGAVHPAQALKTYRQQMGIDAKLVVVGMVSNGFTVADPKDAGMLDVVGFDAATPPVISDFMRAQSPDNRS